MKIYSGKNVYEAALDRIRRLYDEFDVLIASYSGGKDSTIIFNLMKQERKTKFIKLTEITPYWRNPRENSKTVELVKQSIKDYGYNQLIAVDEKNVILAGHTRYKALVELRITDTIQVLEVKGLTEKEAKEYRIVDNKTSEYTDWTKDLEIELNEIGDLDKMQQYFDEDLINHLKSSMGEEVKDIEMQDVEKNEEYNREHFRKLSKQDARKEDMICPECGHEFQVKY